MDGPFSLTKVPRQVISLKRLALTPFTLKIHHGIHSKYLKEKMEKAGIVKRFARTHWGKKLTARRHKLHMTDFGRFVAMKVHRASFFNPPKATRKQIHIKAQENRKKVISLKAKKLADRKAARNAHKKAVKA